MDPSLSMHRNGLESMDMNQFQGDANKLNPTVLRGNTMYTHIISIPRNTENEYIDHALLSPDYIQNGLVVDIIQSQSHDQQPTLASHSIYNSETIEQNASPLEMTTDRHFITNNENIQMPMESIHHFESNLNTAKERKLIVGEQGRQYILTNEAPVIVSNKEASAISMNGLDFPNTYNQIDQTQLNDQHELDAKIQAGNALPPLPPLTPISKLQSMRKTPTIEQQQAMQYKTSIQSSASLNLSKNNTMCFVTDEDDVNFVQSNVKLIRQSSKEQSQTKKSLPHKKRITKKLKIISQHNDLAHLQPQSHHEQSTLNLTMNQQPIQLTTRVNQSSNQTDYIQSDHFANTSEAANSMHTVQLHQMTITETQPTRYTACDIQKFTCELCGAQTQSQLGFFNHLKLHYEPETVPQNCTKIDSANTDLVLEQNDQSIFQMSNQRAINAPAVILTADNFIRLQNNEQEQDFSCMSGIGNEDITDDESINGYNDNGINVKSEQNNEFSDTEDMLENGVLDKVQRVVDSYIENGTSDVKNFIDLNENHQHSLVENSCNWTTATDNAHSSPNNSLYGIEKSESVNNMNANSFVITSNNQNGKKTIQNHIISNSNQTVIERHEELSLMYDINVNDKDFSIMDDASAESILRRQLIRTENVVNLSNQNQFEPQTEAADSKIEIISMDRDMSKFITESTGSTGTIASTNTTTKTTTTVTTSAKVNIQNEFIEEEQTEGQTDSDVDPSKQDTPKRKKKIYRCKRCSKLCNSKNALQYHFLSHTGERPHQCNDCGKSFFASSALKVHMRLHSGDKPYSCDFCHRPFRQWGDLKYHIQSKHTKEKSHQCEFCGKDFARRYSLIIHRRIHTGEKNYKCEFCNKEFRASSYLQVHRKIHTGEKPFVCDVCGKRFRVRGDLKRHSNIHERNKAKDAKIDDLNCMRNAENNTQQSRTTDTTLDQLVSVMECGDASLPGDNSPEFMQIEYEKNFTKLKNKQDLKTVEIQESTILDYSQQTKM
ncbi:asparagine-rich zinc finger protein AZF1 [Contarinia nasturtii]|uniref:asparagine-rich zinc finger protein AZF1 n=1 Tax=Contarinia nasturtii TaxID=265458 RepID=UPI0012D43F41|nr:asparagine-rich zinc finger protein AZF1 [Contarinia nasturtii]